MMDGKPITTIASRIDWESPYYRIRRDDIRLADGSEAVYNVVEMPDSVFIVPVLEDGRIVLIRNYRHTLGEWVWEVPAGGIKPGQTPEAAARAELREEIGGTAHDLRFLLKAGTMNGLGEHIAHFYLATGVRLGEAQHETLEFMSVHPLPATDVYRLVRRGAMNDALSITGLLLAQAHLGGESVPVDHE